MSVEYVGGCMFKNTGGSRNTRGTDTRITGQRRQTTSEPRPHHTGHGGRLKLSTGDSVWAPGVGGDRARA